MCINTNKNTVLVIDSSKRVNASELSTDFQVNLRAPITTSMVKLDSFKIPLTWYNITSYNYRFIIIRDVTSYSMTLPQGRYNNIVDLLQEMQTLIRSTLSDNTFILSVNAYTGKITISADTDFVVKAGATTATSKSLWVVLGYSDGSSSTQTDPDTSHTFSSVPSFYSLDQYLMLKIDSLEGNVEHINSLQDSTSFILDIPEVSNNQFGRSFVLDTESDKFMTFNNPIRLKSFRVSLYNSDNQLINLNNNNFTITLKIFE